jgi:SAM-dependent methyltransferase
MLTTRERNQISYDHFTADHAKLDIDATMYLAYRDLPILLSEHLFSKNKNQYKILDYGCGAGTSTKIFADLFQKMDIRAEFWGIDINENNIRLAAEKNPNAKFTLIGDDTFPEDLKGGFDLVLCYFVLLENTYEHMLKLLERVNSALCEAGVAIIVNCTAKAYDQTKEWYSANAHYVENTPTVYDASKNKLRLQDGQRVKMTMLDKSTSTGFTFFDYFHRRQTYKKAYHEADLTLLASRKPLGTDLDGKVWKSEKETPIYRIDILCKGSEKPELINAHEQQFVFKAKI